MRKFLIIAAAATLLGSAHAQQPSPDRAAFRAIYEELVEIDTSEATGSCTRAAEAMSTRLRAAGYGESDLRVIVPEGRPDDGNLVAVLRGTSRQRALLLLAHIDVVNANRADWERDPFTLIEENGFFYGRGSADDKAMAAVFVDLMIRLRAENFRPRRSIRLALTCGEETSDRVNGVAYMLEHNREWLQADFALNEGAGGMLSPDGRPLALNVQAGEKIHQAFALTVTNPGGHSSRPVAENAIYRLSAGLTRLSQHQFPVELNPVTRAFFERNFTPSAVENNLKPGLLTGYYEPVIKASRTPQGPYQTPIYKRPADLVTVIPETHRGAVKAGTLTHVRKTGKGNAPYFTRAQIDQGALKGKGLELLYFADTVDIFFMQIQGSGRIELTDGTSVRVHYDGKNGHPYKSIGSYLIEKAILAADKVSLGALATWLKADPERANKVMWHNASYVFFRELKGDEAGAPLGALNVPLTPGRSLAFDPGYHALGTPVYVSAPTLRHVPKASPFNRLMIGQDVGSAIKGPERGDIYFGSGDAAGQIAGVTKHPGRFFVLVPKDASARNEAASDKAAVQKTKQ